MAVGIFALPRWVQELMFFMLRWCRSSGNTTTKHIYGVLNSKISCWNIAHIQIFVEIFAHIWYYKLAIFPHISLETLLIQTSCWTRWFLSHPFYIESPLHFLMTIFVGICHLNLGWDAVPPERVGHSFLDRKLTGWGKMEGRVVPRSRKNMVKSL